MDPLLSCHKVCALGDQVLCVATDGVVGDQLGPTRSNHNGIDDERNVRILLCCLRYGRDDLGGPQHTRFDGFYGQFEDGLNLLPDKGRFQSLYGCHFSRVLCCQCGNYGGSKYDLRKEHSQVGLNSSPCTRVGTSDA